MKKRELPASLTAALGIKATQFDIAKQVARFRIVVETNKTRRRRGDPPAALPVPADLPRGGGRTGGAGAIMTFTPDARDLV